MDYWKNVDLMEQEEEKAAWYRLVRHRQPPVRCEFCNDTGTVYDYVPYGDTWVQMPVACECTEEAEDEASTG